ncbi:hypothetical protein BSZ37_21175 [Rubrivirga marina]|uniref:Uncharacterized protein n=1 Tax=Rubrivirga marina TaxID=1196024 RepID=A0A271ITC9_9BACT|nr:hypothetical protein BSZ37_21175 [Rubrivirga marina]
MLDRRYLRLDLALHPWDRLDQRTERVAPLLQRHVQVVPNDPISFVDEYEAGSDEDIFAVGGLTRLTFSQLTLFASFVVRHGVQCG